MVPDGVAVHDLGEQKLKDVQHERVFELSIDGRVSSKPLRVEAPRSRTDDMDARFEQRIESYVESQLERAFSFGETPKAPTKLALGGAAIGLGVLFMFVVVLVAIVLLVKVVFF